MSYIYEHLLAIKLVRSEFAGIIRHQKWYEKIRIRKLVHKTLQGIMLGIIFLLANLINQNLYALSNKISPGTHLLFVNTYTNIYKLSLQNKFL